MIARASLSRMVAAVMVVALLSAAAWWFWMRPAATPTVGVVPPPPPEVGVVSEGLKAGERIVVEGVIRVRPGTAVKPAAPPAPKS